MDPIPLALLAGGGLAAYLWMNHKATENIEIADKEGQAKISGVHRPKMIQTYTEQKAYGKDELIEYYRAHGTGLGYHNSEELQAGLDKSALDKDWNRPSQRVSHPPNAYIHDHKRRRSALSGSLNLETTNSWTPIQGRFYRSTTNPWTPIQDR